MGVVGPGKVVGFEGALGVRWNFVVIAMLLITSQI
jgi:hypothetical protein